MVLQKDCVFCSIRQGTAPAEVVYEDEATIAFMDINPASQGHVLVVPRRHTRDLFDIEESDACDVMRAAVKVARAVKGALRADGVNLFHASGRAAFQSVFHFHIHVIPRWESDGLRAPWRSVPGDLEDIRSAGACIRRHIEER